MTTNATRIGLATLGSVAVIGGLIGAKALSGDVALGAGPAPEATKTSGNGGAPVASPTSPVRSPTATAPKSTASPPTVATPAAKDGTYTGKPASTRYGNVQVQIDVSDGRIGDIRVIQYPNGDRRDVIINDKAIPILIAQGLAAQSATVDTVSGATYTSEGYRKSLQSAIDQAGL